MIRYDLGLLMEPSFSLRRPRPPRSTLLLACLLAVGCTTDTKPQEPNVILIVVDTLRADHLTQYGYKRETSPGLAEFASHSTIFTRAYSTSSWTQPSVASLFTGLMPSSHQVVVQGAVLSSQFETLAERVSQAGWTSAAFSGNLFISGKSGYHQGFDYFVGHDGHVLAYPDVADMLTVVDSWLAGPDRGSTPWFLYFQPMNCHGPYNVPEEHQAELLGRKPDREFRYQGDLMQSIVRRGDVAARSEATPKFVQSLTDQYDTAVRYSLDTVGELLEMLRSRNLYENSLIIVTSDHGEELFDHGGFSHAYSLYEEVVRVPLWIKLPGQTRAATVDYPVSLIDIYPTILETLDLDLPEGLHGTSLLPFLESDTSRPPSNLRPILLETRWEERAIAAALRIGPFKLIDIRSNYEGQRDIQLLFNLEQDPAELENLAALHPEIAESMASELSQAIDPATSPEAVEKVEFDVEALRALGYVD